MTRFAKFKAYRKSYEESKKNQLDYFDYFFGSAMAMFFAMALVQYLHNLH
ncbi:hypothetical protein BCEN4_740073 [Burkholderia cenocepacia]|nr:hypothetical protein [Burkholderia cenocepacia]CAD9227944.1 hypothetical protein BCEN4_740073 [Burkholderia cenocepacia]